MPSRRVVKTPELMKAIRLIVHNDPKISAGKLAIRLRRKGMKELPSERHLGRLKNEALEDAPETSALYREFSWPASFEDDDLPMPWEAGVAAFDLLTFLHQNDRERPTNGDVLWFWRVTVAAPDAPVATRWQLASQLHWFDLTPLRADCQRAVEWCLIYAPWRSKKAQTKYVEAVRQKEIRGPLGPPGSFKPWGTNFKEPPWWKALMKATVEDARNRRQQENHERSNSDEPV